MPTVISDGKRIARVDEMTQTLQTITYAHHEIHGGGMYRSGFSDTLLADATVDISVLTPSNGKQMHLEVDIDSANAINVWLYEDTEITANGTPIVPLNANRNSKKTTSVEAFLLNGTVVTTNATILAHRQVGSTGERKEGWAGGGGATRSEWVLRENAWYTFRVDELSGSDQHVSLRMEWYEHTPKNDSDTNQ